MLTWNQTNTVADIPSGHKARAILKLKLYFSYTLCLDGFV